MDVKVTQVASDDLTRLSDDVYRRVSNWLHDELPKSVETDPRVELDEAGADVRMHTFADSDLAVLYSLRDVNDDGRDEIVLLTVMELPAARSFEGAAAFTRPVIQSHLSRSARIGQEVLHKLGRL